MQTLIVTALPHSADPVPPVSGPHFHVSLFLTHRLGPGLVSDYPAVAAWPQTLREATISLIGSGGPIAVTPLLDDLDDALWASVFPGDLASAGWTTRDFTDVPWRSFAAHRMQAYALAVHALSMAASPVEAPTADQSPFTKAIFDLLRTRKLYNGRGNRLLLDLLNPETQLDARFTKMLRAQTDGNAASAGSNPLLTLLTDLQLARSYYERDAEQRDYRNAPLPGAQTPRPEPPKFDFHQRASSLADLPPLMRALGLVVDLQVADPASLAGHQWIRGQIEVPGFTPSVDKQPRVRCQTHGTRFTAVSLSEDVIDGALRIGDPTRFQFLSLDPDASALKLERFLRTLPRLKALADNKEPESAAPPTLRSTGFALTRIGRCDQVRDRQEQAPALDAAIASGASPLLGAEQLTRGLRLEVWDDVSKTWHSLHKRLLTIAVDGLGTVLGPVPDEGSLQGAALTKSDVPGVDTSSEPYYLHETVAGWDGWSLSVSRPGLNLVHDDGTEKPTDDQERTDGPVHASSAVAPGTLPRLRYGRSYRMRAWSVDLAGNSPRHDGHPVTSSPPPAGVIDPASSLLATLGDAKLTGAYVEPPLTMPSPTILKTLRRTLPDVPTAVSKIVTTGTPTVASTRLRSVEAAFAKVKPSELLSDPVGPAVDDTITNPVPFLRWEPVLEPTVVPRFPYTEGESLTTMVVRSGVSSDGTATDPATYVEQILDAFAGLGLQWRPDSQRHVLPPKTSQWECELNGLFDFAIGTNDADAQRKALAIALKESGSLFDATIPDVATPGATVSQPGVSLHNSPSVDLSKAVSLAQVQADREARSQLQAGQYVTIDADEIVVPYLPDPLAAGLSMRFPDAGHDHLFPASVFLEGMQTDYLGDWPLPRPYRLVLTSGDELGASVQDTVIRVSLPPGRQLRLVLSSSVPKVWLDRLGLWHSLSPALKDNDVVAQAAADGWFWWLTPGHELRFVHAVPRPVTAPRFTLLVPARKPDETSAALVGGVHLDGPSSERLDIEGEWDEYTDDITTDGPRTLAMRGAADGSVIGYTEQIAVLAPTSIDVPPPSTFGIHKTVHEFGDTKHRLVRYRARATTRYREYFPAQILADVEDMSLRSEPREVHIPSSAHPAPPAVRDVLPMFRWEEQTEPHQPFGVRRTRRSGLRVLLERPWHSSGEGELLAVLISTDPKLDVKVSHWGADPVFLQTGPRSMHLLPLMDLLHLTGVDDRRDAASPATQPASVRLHPADGAGSVLAVGYEPVWDASRGCWVVDIGIDPGMAYWPFVQLTLARYQPHSLSGLELSKVVRCDPVQIAPLRFTTVTRPNGRTARIAVTGPIGVPQAPFTPNVHRPSPWTALTDMHNVRARLERFDAALGSDLGWQTVATTDLQLLTTPGSAQVTWSGDLTLPTDLPPARPDGGSGWRVSVEEWEKLMTDSEQGKPRTHARMVYAEQIEL